MEFSVYGRSYQYAGCESKEQKSVLRSFVFLVLRKYRIDSSFNNLLSARYFGIQGCVVTGKVRLKCEDEEENRFYQDNFQKFVWNIEEM
jgi:hypothetical protein